jgi:hypothetical protein
VIVVRRRIEVTAVVAAAVLLAAGAGVTRAMFTDAPPLGGNAFSSATLEAPTGLGATAGCQLLAPRIVLQWTATSSTFADGYDVYRATTSGGPYTLITHVAGRTTTTYTNTGGLSLNTTYYYVLKSTAYSWTSANSSQTSAKTPVVCLI